MTFTGYNIPVKSRKSLPPRKKGLQCGLLAGLQLLSELPLWVSTSVASCVRVISSITAPSTISSRMPGIASAQQTTAPEFSFFLTAGPFTGAANDESCAARMKMCRVQSREAEFLSPQMRPAGGFCTKGTGSAVPPMPSTRRGFSH